MLPPFSRPGFDQFAFKFRIWSRILIAISSWMHFAVTLPTYSAGVYVADEKMNELGTAAVHLLTVATSYIRAQKE
jgi:hypothetical protein